MTLILVGATDLVIVPLSSRPTENTFKGEMMINIFQELAHNVYIVRTGTCTYLHTYVCIYMYVYMYEVYAHLISKHIHVVYNTTSNAACFRPVSQVSIVDIRKGFLTIFSFPTGDK